MKKQLILLCFAILAIFSLNLINAEALVTYDAYYAEINNDGSITYTSTQVNDFDTLGYVCLNSDCSNVGEKILGLTKSTNSNSITLSFPTNLKNSNGYGIWFYKPGYIHWERSSDWAGSGTVQEHYNVFFLKKAQSWAPIMDLNVINEVNPNIPVEVGVKVGIDADTYSAIENAGPLKYNPQELNSLNVVDTKVTLEITNSANNVIYTENKILSIPYSESEQVNFSYSGFILTGDYKIKVSTDVQDSKVLSSLTQSESSNIRVIPQGLTDYSYTLINGLEMSPTFPEVNQSVDFSFDYLSNYIDVFGALTSLDTNAKVIFYKEGNAIQTNNYVLSKLNNEFSISKTFTEAGNYSIFVEGTPSVCMGANGCFSLSQELNFVIKVKQVDPTDDTTAPIITLISPVNNTTYNTASVLISFTTNEQSTGGFELDSGTYTSISGSTNFQYILTGLIDGTHTLKIYARDIAGNTASKTISFNISTGTSGLDLYIDNGYMQNLPLYDDEDASVRFKTHNTGNTALSVPVEVYLNNVLMAGIPTLPFGVGERDWGVGFGELPSGNYELRIVIDSTNSYSETNELNNEFIYNFEVLKCNDNPSTTNHHDSKPLLEDEPQTTTTASTNLEETTIIPNLYINMNSTKAGINWLFWSLILLLILLLILIIAVLRRFR